MTNDLHILEEPTLIDWLKKNQGEIAFIAEELPRERNRRTETLKKAIDDLDEAKWLFEQKADNVAQVWRNLFGKAIAYLKFKDDREVYHDDEDYGVDRINAFFDTFRRFEALLYGAEERYRDHMMHTLGVYLIGQFLIKNTIGFEKVDAGTEAYPADNISPDEKEAMWCVMALAHDLGIALEKIPRISEKVEDMLDKFGIVGVQGLTYPFLRFPLDDLTVAFVSADLRVQSSDEKEVKNQRFVTHIQSKYYLKFSEAYERRDHGIVSCLVLMKNLVYFLETDYTLDMQKPLDMDDAKQFLIRRNILRSIASHSNDNIYYIKVNEFSFLLRIFDELHERERPRLIEISEGEKIDTRIKVRLNENEVFYQISFTWKSQAGLSDEEKNELRKNVGEYFDRKYERFTRILRSAVGGKERNLILTLEVIDELSTPVKTYKLVHTTPQDIIVTRP